MLQWTKSNLTTNYLFFSWLLISDFGPVSSAVLCFHLWTALPPLRLLFFMNDSEQQTWTWFFGARKRYIVVCRIDRYFDPSYVRNRCTKWHFQLGVASMAVLLKCKQKNFFWCSVFRGGQAKAAANHKAEKDSWQVHKHKWPSYWGWSCSSKVSSSPGTGLSAGCAHEQWYGNTSLSSL